MFTCVHRVLNLSSRAKSRVTRRKSSPRTNITTVESDCARRGGCRTRWRTPRTARRGAPASRARRGARAAEHERHYTYRRDFFPVGARVFRRATATPRFLKALCSGTPRRRVQARRAARRAVRAARRGLGRRRRRTSRRRSSATRRRATSSSTGSRRSPNVVRRTALAVLRAGRRQEDDRRNAPRGAASAGAGVFVQRKRKRKTKTTFVFVVLRTTRRKVRDRRKKKPWATPSAARCRTFWRGAARRWSPSTLGGGALVMDASFHTDPRSALFS